MVSIRYTIDDPGKRRREVVLPLGIVKIGKLSSSHIQLAHDSVSRMHAIMENYDIIDLGSTAGTLVNGTRVNKTGLYSGDRLQLGECAVWIQIVDPRARTIEDPTELALLAAIEAGDHDSRAIYADWLEQRGEPKRAELLRARSELDRLAAVDRMHRSGRIEHSGAAEVPPPLVVARRISILEADLDRDWCRRVLR